MAKSAGLLEVVVGGLPLMEGVAVVHRPYGVRRDPCVAGSAQADEEGGLEVCAWAL